METLTRPKTSAQGAEEYVEGPVKKGYPGYPNPAAPEVNGNVLTPRILLGLCLHAWPWFVASVIICLGAAFYYLQKTQPVYTRNASLLVKDEGNGGTAVSSEFSSMVDMGMFAPASNVLNEIASIQSPALISDVVKKLNLTTNYWEPGKLRNTLLYGTSLPISVDVDGKSKTLPYSFRIEMNGNKFTLDDLTLEDESASDATFSGTLGQPVKTPIGNITVSASPFFKGGQQTILVSHDDMLDVVRSCLSKLTAELAEEKTTIVDLKYEDISPERAEDFLSALVASYNESWIQERNQVAVSTSQFINDRLALIESELGNVDSDISSFKSSHLLPDLNAATGMYLNKSSQNDSQILQLSTQLSIAEYILSYLKSAASTNQLLPANTGLDNAAIANQINEYNTLQMRRNTLLANGGDSNPLVLDADKSLNEMRGAIIASINNHINSLRTSINSFQRSQSETQASIAANPNQEKYLLSVERQQKVKETLYLYLLQKREENELSQAYTAYNTRLVSPPTGPKTPTSPVPFNIMLIAFLLGLLIPVGIIYLREIFNTKLRGKKDLEGMDVPIIGEIPQNGPVKRKFPFFGKKKEVEEKREIVIKPHGRDIINEAMRVLRTNLEFMFGKNYSSKVLLTTSANPGSGKTFVTLNIAASFALKEKRVLVIDLDLRKASLSEAVDNPKYGVSDYLVGHKDCWQNMLVEARPNLDVLPVGTIPPNPAELLSRPELGKLIEEARKEYDIVFLDCPPVELVADTTIISEFADITIFIVRAGLLERDMLPIVDSYYTEGRLPAMTLLLNGTTTYGRYGYNYGYGYGLNGYGYGYAYSGKKE